MGKGKPERGDFNGFEILLNETLETDDHIPQA